MLYSNILLSFVRHSIDSFLTHYSELFLTHCLIHQIIFDSNINFSLKQVIFPKYRDK